MQLEVQWFISLLIDNNLMTKETGIALNNELGGNPDLMTFAQTFLDRFTQGMSQADQENCLQQFQQVMEYSQTQAAAGLVPPVFADAPKASPNVDSGEIDALMTALDTLSQMENDQVRTFVQTLLNTLRDFGASDLHISANAPIFYRKAQKNIRLRPDHIITKEESKQLIYSMLTPEQIATFETNQDCNLALEIGEDRYRVSLMVQKEGYSASYHIIPDKIRSLTELGFLPEDAKTMESLLDYHNGLILVTGPLGSGKTSTLAALVSVANERRQDHIIMVEDPIEIVIPSKNCQVTQRQIGTCTNSYHAALKGALREDPDIIVIGEMHDLETIENAITAAETGHLVIGTLHTCDASNTLNRILDVFPPAQQNQIRTMTAGSLRGVICQKLIPSVSGKLVPAYELLLNTLAVTNLIQEGKIFQLRATMQIGSKAGMCTIDQNILKQYQLGIISDEVADANLKDAAVIETFKKERAIAKAKEYAAAKKAAKR